MHGDSAICANYGDLAVAKAWIGFSQEAHHSIWRSVVLQCIKRDWPKRRVGKGLG
jgi:hypothetical protein